MNLPTKPTAVKPKNTLKDGVNAYAQEVLTLTLIWAEFEDAIREGDGLRVIRCWRFMLLISKQPTEQTTPRKLSLYWCSTIPSSPHDSVNSWYGPVLSTRKENLVQISHRSWKEDVIKVATKLQEVQVFQEKASGKHNKFPSVTGSLISRLNMKYGSRNG